MGEEAEAYSLRGMRPARNASRPASTAAFMARAMRTGSLASAMRKAVEAGREAFLAGRIPRKRYASASSPVDGLIG